MSERSVWNINPAACLNERNDIRIQCDSCFFKLVGHTETKHNSSWTLVLHREHANAPQRQC